MRRPDDPHNNVQSTPENDSTRTDANPRPLHANGCSKQCRAGAQERAVPNTLAAVSIKESGGKVVEQEVERGLNRALNEG